MIYRLKPATGLLLCVCMSASITMNAQSVGIGTSTPHVSAQLDISSTSKGVLVPRMTMAQKNAIATPAQGLLVFVTEDSSFYYYAASSWQQLNPASSNWLLSGNATATGKYLGTKDTSAFRIITRGQERITIDSTGAIGINNKTPLDGIHMVDDGSGNSDLFIEYNRDDSRIPGVVLMKSKGTYENKEAVDSGMSLGVVSFAGFAKNNQVASHLGVASISARAAKKFEYPAFGADLNFSVTNRELTGPTQTSFMTLTHEGRFGVGTTTPDYLIEGRGRNADDGGVFQLANSDQTHVMRLFSGRQNDPNPFMLWKAGDPMRFATDENGFTEHMRIQSNGNVGIANNDPLEKLDIGQFTEAGPVYVKLKTEGTNVNVPGSKYAGIKLRHFSENYGFDIQSEDGQTRAGLDIITRDGGAPRTDLTIRRFDGNVGIGTTDPLDKLHVMGNIRVADDSQIFGVDGIWGFNDLRFFGDGNGGPDLTIRPDGRAGFGSVENIASLNVRRIAGDLIAFRVENEAGNPKFQVGGLGQTGVNQWYGNITMNVRGITGDLNYSRVENPAGDPLFQVLNNGNVAVTNTLSKGGGSFKIDHPLDPEHKFLYHSFVESPDMMNVYNGNITTDGNGSAVVEMPEWFEALNRDFRYQLTVIGQFAQAIVQEELHDNQFTIITDKPNVKVSWQITGIRHDAFAEKNRIPVEEDKKGEEVGRYLHPAAFGKPAAMQLGRMKETATPGK